MTTIKYFAFNVWVMFEGSKESTPFFDLVACDIQSALADITHTYQENFTLISYGQGDMVKEVKYNF